MIQGFHRKCFQGFLWENLLMESFTYFQNSLRNASRFFFTKSPIDSYTISFQVYFEKSFGNSLRQSSRNLRKISPGFVMTFLQEFQKFKKFFQIFFQGKFQKTLHGFSQKLRHRFFQKSIRGCCRIIIIFLEIPLTIPLKIQKF